ncbi:MAG: GNAT family N-acetyltransferase [Bacteroidales bacterium]|nr:GNAT family N-acetyltransferase [Bacteroidales bacterium]
MRHRYARKTDLPAIMTIIHQAKARMKAQHIDQWQDGYPNEESIFNDIAHKQGYVFIIKDEIVAYAAIVFEHDPYYDKIDGQWLTDMPYVVVHRIAVHDRHTHQGIAKQILNTAEKLANKKDVQSFRIDTHQANHFMRNLIRQHGFTLCGIVQVRDGRRMAYEINLQSRHNESCQA